MEIRTYSVHELQAIADDVGERRGWDFGRMATERDPVPWDFMDVVAAFLRPTDVVLDIGTGGGERLVRLASAYASGVGVDPDPAMIRVARSNARGVPNVRFLQASAEHLAPLEGEAFDVVLTRHAPVDVAELNRVTKSGGLFLCQGVGARNMANIRRAFNTGSEAAYLDAHQSVLRDLSARSWHLVTEAQYDVRYRVKDVPSLIFWFKAIAGANEVPADFSVATHHEVINALIHEFGTPRGLATNEHRTLIIARKPDGSGRGHRLAQVNTQLQACLWVSPRGTPGVSRHSPLSISPINWPRNCSAAAASLALGMPCQPVICTSPSLHSPPIGASASSEAQVIRSSLS